MTLIINPNSISYSLIKNELLSYVKNKPDGEAWRDFFDSSSGNVLIELLAGTSAFLTFNAITSRRETYLNYAKNRPSTIAIAENLSYNVSRGRNAHVQLVIQSNDVFTINKWDVVGSVNDVQLIAWETKTVYPSVPVLLECVVGNLITNITYDVTTANTDVFRILAGSVSDDVRLLFRKTIIDNYIDLDKENAMGTRLLDLLEDKYVLLTNPYEAVDVYYLNNKPNLLNVGDEIQLITSGTLPSPLIQNKSYYVIPRGENLIKLALLEIDAYNDVPINLTTEGEGLHLLNSTYSFVVDDVLTDTIAVDGIFPKYQYGNGSTLRLDYIELKDSVFILGDVEFYNGIIDMNDSRTKILSPYIAPEAIGNIKVNAPLFFETQFVVKGREDYRKILKRLDSSFLDTNSKDVSPAVIEVTYLKNDLTYLTKEQKLSMVQKLNLNRPFGDEPANIVNPVQVNYTLNIVLTLYNTGVTIPNVNQEIQNVLSYEPEDNGIITLREKHLGYSLNLYQLEHEIDHLLNSDSQRFIQIARVSVATSVYTLDTSYVRGNFVTSGLSANYIFEAVKIIGKSRVVFTTDFCNITTPSYLTITAHGLIDGQVIKVLRTGEGKLPAPLSENNIYYVTNQDSNHVSLSYSSGGEWIRYLNNGSGNIGVNYIITGFVFTTDFTNQPTRLTITAHGFVENQPIEVYSSGDLPNPLVEGQVYYVKLISGNANAFELKTSTTGTAIVLTNDGSSGSTHTLHTGIGAGRTNSSTSPAFNTASSTVTEFIDNEVVWKAVDKTVIDYQIGWNEYFMFDFNVTF